MNVVTGRRGALKTFALSLAASAIALASARGKPAAGAVESALTPAGATHLDALKRRLTRAPRRRDFKTVPMILNHQEQWDQEALTEVLSYGPAPRQLWDNTDIGGPWLNLRSGRSNIQISSLSR